MRRTDLEHVIRAAAAVSGEHEFVVVGANDAVAYCLEPHDLAASKLAANREKDRAFVAAMLEHKIVDPEVLRSRIEGLPVQAERKRELREWASRQATPPRPPSEG